VVDYAAIAALTTAKDAELARVRDEHAKVMQLLLVEREKSAKVEAERAGAARALEHKSREYAVDKKYMGEKQAQDAATTAALIEQLGRQADLVSEQTKQVQSLVGKVTDQSVHKKETHCITFNLMM
jgi:hypothetical protein